MSAVIDTDVFSFIFKGDTRKSLYEPYTKDRFLFLSFMSLAELWNWTLTRNWGINRRDELVRSLRQYSIQNSNYDICILWSELKYEANLSGKPLGESDAWVAATAIFLDVPLMSHNANHFKHIKRLDLITCNKEDE